MRYHFHIIRDGSILYDPQGEEVADPAGLPDIAIRYIRQITSEELRKGRPIPLRWRLHITGSDYEVAGNVSFAKILSA